MKAEFDEKMLRAEALKISRLNPELAYQAIVRGIEILEERLLAEATDDWCNYG
jgi:hypothetical protein